LASSTNSPENPNGNVREAIRRHPERHLLCREGHSKEPAQNGPQAKSEHLAAAFEEHIDQTEAQVDRLEKIFDMIGKSPRGKRCPAIDGLAEEAGEIMQEAKDDTVRDAGMLAADQSVEHYEISRYGTLAAWADKLGLNEAVSLLRETLQEEKDTDAKLSELALSEINVEADAAKGADRGPKGHASKRHAAE
jgi:ferritin-like metal-binding protein YciE